jgi:hypothetical protein
MLGCLGKCATSTSSGQPCIIDLKKNGLGAPVEMALVSFLGPIKIMVGIAMHRRTGNDVLLSVLHFPHSW